MSPTMPPGNSAHRRRRFQCPAGVSNALRSCCEHYCRSIGCRGQSIRWRKPRTSAQRLPGRSGRRVIDINGAFADEHRSGVMVEQLTVDSLVETLAVNVPGIQRVKILVDGKDRDTLAGHADLSDRFDVQAMGSGGERTVDYRRSAWAFRVSVLFSGGGQPAHVFDLLHY